MRGSREGSRSCPAGQRRRVPVDPGCLYRVAGIFVVLEEAHGPGVGLEAPAVLIEDRAELGELVLGSRGVKREQFARIRTDGQRQEGGQRERVLAPSSSARANGHLRVSPADARRPGCLISAGQPFTGIQAQLAEASDHRQSAVALDGNGRVALEAAGFGGDAQAVEGQFLTRLFLPVERLKAGGKHEQGVRLGGEVVILDHRAPHFLGGRAKVSRRFRLFRAGHVRAISTGDGFQCERLRGVGHLPLAGKGYPPRSRSDSARQYSRVKYGSAESMPTTGGPPSRPHTKNMSSGSIGVGTFGSYVAGTPRPPVVS
jgi:hypothetical protein